MRSIRRADWTRLSNLRYARRRIMFCNAGTEAQIMYIGACSAPYIAGGRVIADTGMKWLQLAPENGTWWLTAMYSRDDMPVQYYFDITAGNMVPDGKDAAFTDMYIDAVMEPDGSYIVTDKDELDAALACGDVSESGYAAAIAATAELEKLLGRDLARAIDDVYHKLRRSEPCEWDEL